MDKRSANSKAKKEPKGKYEAEEWLTELKDLKEQEREKRRLSEPRTVRFTKSDAEHISRRSNQLDISDAEYIRLMCSNRRPDMIAANRTITRLCDLISRFAGAFKGLDKKSDAKRLEHVSEEMERQAKEILAEHSDK